MGGKILKQSTLWTAGLITGNLIGAGILALPVSLGVCGLAPSLILMVIYGALMFYSAEILSREAIERKNAFFDLPSLYAVYLGNFGKWAAILTNGIILYGLLVAYISGGAQIIADLADTQSGKSLIALGLAIVLSFLTILDLSVINKYNAVLVGVLLCAFGALIFLSFPAMNFSRLEENHWQHAPLAIPLIVTACHFHNIIPLLCRDLNWDLKAMRKAILWKYIKKRKTKEQKRKMKKKMKRKVLIAISIVQHQSPKTGYHRVNRSILSIYKYFSKFSNFP